MGLIRLVHRRRGESAAFAGAHDRREDPRLFTTKFAADVARLNQCSLVHKYVDACIL